MLTKHQQINVIFKYIMLFNMYSQINFNKNIYHDKHQKLKQHNATSHVQHTQVSFVNDFLLSELKQTTSK